MINYTFMPPNATVNAGDLVTWTNVDTVFHTSTSGTNGLASGLWDSSFFGPGSSYSFSASLPPGYYSYYCTLHYQIGMVGSLTVLPTNLPPAPVILTQPMSQTVTVGSTVSFLVNASGAPPLTYQWQFDGQPIASATDATLVLSNVQTSASGEYAVQVTNPGGSTNSQPATLTVSPLESGGLLVSILSPTNNAIFPASATVLLSASATESNGTIRQVQFFLNSAPVGIASNSPYAITVSNLAVGSYLLTATATDTQSNSALSGPVHFTVPGPPTVTLLRSPTNLNLVLGTMITNTAGVATSGSAVTNVEFFAGTTLLGSASVSPFVFVWTPAQAGPYTLTAIAFDNLGQTATSGPVSVLIFTPDSVPPTVRITSAPPNFALLPSPLVQLAGTASDNVAVEEVEYQVNGGPFLLASGTESWTASVAVPAGAITINVVSMDLAGNVSQPATRFYTRIVEQALTVRVHGEGTVMPDLNGKLLEIGEPYRLKAMAKPGQIFAGWQGATGANGAVLDFLMQSNLVLEADFVPSPFTGLSGSYSGLVLDTNDVSPATSASLLLQLNASGTFSGKLGIGGASYPIRGSFDSTGRAQFPVVPRTLAPELLTLHLDLTGNSEQITGTAASAEGGNVLVTPLLAVKSRFSRGGPPAPQAGVHSFLFARTAADGGGSVGTALAEVTATGLVLMRGQLSDGRKFMFSSVLSKQGDVPFYMPLPGSELIVGWLNFPAGEASVATGSLYWIKTVPGGFVFPLAVLGAQ